ncbi:MAG: hypothetical protein AB1627_01075 [Chloroflexota bacterium]
MAGRNTGAGALLSRDAILAAADYVTADVAVPEWGGTVRVKGLTGRERDSYEASILSGKGKNRDINLRNARAKLVVMAAIDEAGNRVFDDADVVALGQKSALALQRVFDKASELAGLDDEAIENLTAELGNDPSGDSGSA